jgi:hypothetical protein
VVASGRAARLGIEERCAGEDLQPVELGPQHLVACHAAPLETAPRPVVDA